MGLFEKFVAELRLAGFTENWIINHISITEEEDLEGTNIRFSFNYFSAPIAESLHQFSIANQVHILEFAHVKFSHLEFFESFPKLHTLHLRYYYFIPLPVGGSSRRRIDRTVVLPSLPNLETLIIEEIYPEELVTLDFSQVPQLKSLQITINASLATALHHVTFPKINLDQLEFLSIKFVGSLEVREDLLSLPDLRTLHIKCTSLGSGTQDVLQRLTQQAVDVLVESW